VNGDVVRKPQEYRYFLMAAGSASAMYRLSWTWVEVGPKTGLLLLVSLLTEVPTAGASEEEDEQDTELIISKQLEVYKKADTKTLNSGECSAAMRSGDVF